jgi:hypothetical protein
MPGLHPTTLWKILTQRCGDTWKVRFRSKRLAIDETITLNVPRLHSSKTINKIQERVDGNKTYGHGPMKNQYLLAQMVFCIKCGYTMFD